MKCVSACLPRALLTAALATCPIAVAPSASAQTPAPAVSSNDDLNRELMDQGFAALKRNDLEGARTAFSEVWERHPHAVVGMSLAEVEMRLGLFASAAAHWQQVVLELPATMSDERNSARRQLELCKAHVGAITLQVTPDGSSVVVDDKPVGDAPLRREVFLEPGFHSVYAVRGGRRSIGRTFHVSEGGRLSFTLAVPGTGDATPAPGQATTTRSTLPASRNSNPPVASAERRRSGLKVPLVVAGGVATLAAAGLGTYSAVKSNSASGDAASAGRDVEAAGDPAVPKASLCVGPERPAACGALANDLADVDRFKTLSIGAFIGAGALAAGTLATMLLWTDSATSPAKEADAAQLHVVPLLGSMNGLGLSGTF